MPLLSVLETAHYDLPLGPGTFASYYTMQVYNPARAISLLRIIMRVRARMPSI